ncbi:MAG TPA: YHS domain-containing protein [Chitinophagaceae bacterium]|nr:YHS domain-containing protein [Chitinophagaceae bacterium]
MKNSVLFMAFPAFLVVAFFIINKPTGKSCPMEKDKAACMSMCMSQCSNQCGDMNLAPDTLRPDPICDMKVDDKKGDTIHYKGHIFGFCSKYCRTEFLKNPDKYLPKK